MEREKSFDIMICDLIIDRLESGEILSEEDYEVILHSINNELGQINKDMLGIDKLYYHVQNFRFDSSLYKDSYDRLLDATRYLLDTRKKMRINDMELSRGVLITSMNLTRDNIYTLTYQGKEMENYICGFIDFNTEYIKYLNGYSKKLHLPIGMKSKEKMEDSFQKIKKLSKEYVIDRIA